MLRIKDSTRITERNVHCFLRRFAKGISLDELELIPRRYGDSIMFYYGSDKMLKVPKNGHRRGLLAETTISRYLNTQSLPMAFAEPLIVHPEGFYAVFSRIDGVPLTAEKVAGFTSSELTSVARSIGSFLTFLHGHEFPSELISRIPRPLPDLEADLRRVYRKILFIKIHGTEVDTQKYEESLARLEGSLNQAWTVTHSDFTLNHVLLVQGKVEQIGVIDFADARVCDPSVDFSEFAADLAGEGVQPRGILEKILSHCDREDSTIRQKIHFRLLVDEIHMVYRAVRDSLA